MCLATTCLGPARENTLDLVQKLLCTYTRLRHKCLNKQDQPHNNSTKGGCSTTHTSMNEKHAHTHEY